MALSAYWVRFFEKAGFSSDVATKHAVVFSNNRIKPDMLPELDKPSLKEMGITLMGDMIAILRYAKKVVEETTCERFLVDTEHSSKPVQATVKTLTKKVVKNPLKSTVVSKTPSMVKPLVGSKNVKPIASSTAKTTVLTVKKKVIPSSKSNHTYAEYPVDNINRSERPVSASTKRKYDDGNSDVEDEWVESYVKRAKNGDDDVGYKRIMPKSSTIRGQKTVNKVDLKKNVFHRLGDSAVTSTTGSVDSSTTFTVTGLGNDTIKRNSSVFNRLGLKDDEDSTVSRTVKNGTNLKPKQSILKSRPSMLSTTVVTTKKATSRSLGTMHADFEKPKNSVSDSVKMLVKTTKRISFGDNLRDDTFDNNRLMRKISYDDEVVNTGSFRDGVLRRSVIKDSSNSFTNNSPRTLIVSRKSSTGKLASEVSPMPAKARLGVSKSKQVTFNKIATVSHFKKPGVFSRLGV